MTNELPAPTPFVSVSVGDTFEYNGRTGYIKKVNPAKYVVRMDDDGKDYNLRRTEPIVITGRKSITDIFTKPDFFPTQRVRLIQGKNVGVEFIISRVDAINATYSGKTVDGMYTLSKVPFTAVELA